MVVASLVISILAVALSLIVAGFGIFIQFKMYEATTGQLGEMKDLVGQLHGLTDRLVEIQQHQFDKMLDAFVTRPGEASAAADSAGASASEVSSALARLDELQQDIASKGDVAGLQRELARISSQMESAAASASNAARLAQRAAYGPSRVLQHAELEGVLDELDKAERAGEKLTPEVVVDRLRSRFDVERLDAERILREVGAVGSITQVTPASGSPYISLTDQGRGYLAGSHKYKRG